MGVGDLENSKDVLDWRVFKFWKEVVEAKSKILGEAAASEVRNPARVQAENVMID